MAYIGQSPAVAALTASDITDGIITNAKLAQDIISADTALAVAPAATDEFLVSDSGVLKRIDYSLIAGTNTPRFFALKHSDANQTISDATGTVITFDIEVFDSNSAFASNAFTVPSGEGGTYMIGVGANIGAGTYSQLDHAIVYLLKDGTITSNYGTAFQSNPIYNTNLSFTDVHVLEAGDVLTTMAYANVNSGDGHISGNGDSRRETYFYGYKLIT